MLFKLTDCTAERSKSIFWRKNNLETVRQKRYHVIIGTVFLIQFTLVISQDFPCSLQSRVKWGIIRGRGSCEGVWHSPPPILVSQKTEREGSGGLFCSDNSTVSVALILPLVNSFSSKNIIHEELTSETYEGLLKKKGNYFRFQDWLVNKRPFKFPNLVLKIRNHFKFLTSWKQIRDQMIIHHIPRIKFQSLDVVSCKNSF